jgi:hypothetical protein
MMKFFRRMLLVFAGAIAVAHIVLAQQSTAFTNQGTIANTRHNMTQRTPGGGIPAATLMDNYRNNYAEVCVYCHTPHTANASVKAPLWNRNFKATTYTTYDKLDTATLTQTVYQPGAASLMCLSCHDGQQAVDAVLHMPGSQRYSATPDSDFLNTWNNPTGPYFMNARTHFRLQAVAPGVTNVASCLVCHQPAAFDANGDQYALTGAPDFTAAAIGTDLRNDHPVGVKFPATTGTGTDWKTPSGSLARGALVSLFFDENNNQRMNKGDIRLYDSGNGPVVECASCHDPHGVPSGAAGSKFNPTFLRKTNQNSAVCLTCHAK